VITSFGGVKMTSPMRSRRSDHPGTIKLGLLERSPQLSVAQHAREFFQKAPDRGSALAYSAAMPRSPGAGKEP
jgi:hypothetical protein